MMLDEDLYSGKNPVCTEIKFYYSLMGEVTLFWIEFLWLWIEPIILIILLGKLLEFN